MSADDSGDPRRVHARYPVDWRVALRCPDWQFVEKVAAQNASRGGLFILTSRPPVVGSQVELTLSLPDGTTLNLHGTVQHIVTPERASAEGRSPGIGVKIDDTHAADLVLLEAMAQNAKEEAADAPSHDVDMDMEEPEPRARAASPVPALMALPGSGRTGTGARPRAPTAPSQILAKVGVVASGQAARAVGIDFGTTYTSMAIVIGDAVHIVTDDMGRALHPSIVSYPERGAPLVGWAARPRLAQDPRRTISSVKRLLGKSFSDPNVAGHLASAAYKTTAGPDDSILIDVAGNQLAVPQICAAILGHVRDLAEAQLHRPVKEAVLSCPVSFTESEKSAIRKAAQIAGLDVVGLVEEPVSGALAYGYGHEVNEIVAVYDFGGGTFDFTVMDFSNDRFRVLATEGDAWLGGDDFDIRLAQAVADALWRATKVELRSRQVEWQRLIIACEQAKRELSTEPVSRVVVEAIIEQPKRIDLRQKIERPLFERLCRDLFERSLEVCQMALGRAGLEPADVTQVVVTGGVSRIPFVRAGLAELFGREITAVVNPEEAIVIGAALRAARVAAIPRAS